MLAALASYWLTIFPVAHAELARWRVRAAAIPQPLLRRVAQATLAEEGLNAEGAALFALLAPPARRTATTRLLVRFQVMYDFLDALTELPLPATAPAPLAVSRQLHRALVAALGGPPPAAGYYALHPAGDDGGYLAELVAGCRRGFRALPGARQAAPLALRAAARSAEGQSRCHAAAGLREPRALMRWAQRETPPSSGLLWFETAAAAESSLVIHALLASAADPRLTHAAAARVAAAYWPWITGLNALLDDLVDGAEDAATGTHSHVPRYRHPRAAAERLGAIAAHASAAVGGLPRGRRHALILAAMTSFYLASPHAALADTAPAARAVRDALATDLRPLLAMLRARRRLAALTRRRAPAAAPVPPARAA